MSVRAAPVAVATAHGRVNLIGEHTDYNDGWVLPTAIPQAVHVEARPRSDRLVCVRSEAHPGEEIFELGHEEKGRGWIDYVQGVTAALSAHGERLGGADLAIRSDVPMGAGLASSAALSVAVLRALCALFGLTIDARTLARMAQSAEQKFAGAQVGIMDPLAALLAHEGRALLVDTRSLAVCEFPLPSTAELVVLDSGVRHAHAGGQYNRRREECAAACMALGVASLRDVQNEPEPWTRGLNALLARRVRHVVTENARVLSAARALEADDPLALGELLTASHRSLRDDYEVSIPELDRLVEAGAGDPAVFGGRMTGGGFGGSVLLLARSGEGAAVARRALERAAVPGARILLPRL